MERNRKDNSLIRSFTAEYLTFVASTGDSEESIEMRYEDEKIWLTQKMMAELYDVDVRTINDHIQKVLNHGELNKESVIRKYRITASDGKNYLSEKEMKYLERIVSVYLDYAELQAERKIPMTMQDWAKRLDGFLEFNGNEILIGAGKISHEQAKLHAETEFEKYRVIQDRLFESDFDKFVIDNYEMGLDIEGGEGSE
jgi:hypothetical protein